MSFQASNLTIANLIGNTIIPRNSAPLLRASSRRADPTGTIVEPYYAGLSAKKLDLEYTDINLIVQTATLTFSSDNYADALATVSSADPANIEAVDMDGFLAIRNRNSGNVHYLKITSQALPGNEAAGVLGFSTDPSPGSVSYAGELASTPGTRKQGNPQGTALIGKDEDLSGPLFNRALTAIIQYFERDKIDLDHEILVTQEVSVTLQNNQVIAADDGIPLLKRPEVANVFVLNDPTFRIPANFFSSSAPTGVQLEELFKLIITSTKNEVILPQTDGGGRFRVRSVHYSTAPTTGNFRDSIVRTFGAWGTPDDDSIFGNSSLQEKDKHPTIAITSIHDGNTIVCDGATFVTLNVQAGDTLYITDATGDVPFTHNGEYVIERVLDEETIQVRPKSAHEPLVWASITSPRPVARPTELNQSGGFGNATIPVGFFLPASHLVFTLEHVGGTPLTWGLLTATAPAVSLLLKTGMPLRLAAARALAREFNVPPDAVLAYIDYHISTGGHPASAISWTAPQPTWSRTSESISGANLKDLIISILAMLGDNETATTAETGASRVGSPALTGASPNHIPKTLPAGTVKSQLLELLTDLNQHINNAAVHNVSESPYSGSPAWKDGTVVPAVITQDAAISRIVTDIGGATGGAAKINILGRNAWLGGRTNPATDVFTAVNKIITDLAINNATGDDGAERVGANSSIDIPAAGSVRSQLDYIAANWAKTSRANTWTQAQTMNGAAGDTSAALITSVTPTARKLLWNMTMPGSYRNVRVYVSTNGLEVTTNAGWNGSQWVADNAAATSTRHTLSNMSLVMQVQANGSPPWAEGSWGGIYVINSQPSAGISASSPNTFTAPQTFNGGVDLAIPSLITSMTVGSSTRKLLWEAPYAGAIKWRMYAGNSSGFEFYVNAKWNLGGVNTWSPDVVGQPASRFTFGTNGIAFCKIDSAPASFSDGALPIKFSFDTQPVMSLPTMPVAGQLAKAHGYLTVSGAGVVAINAYKASGPWWDGDHIGVTVHDNIILSPTAHIVCSMRFTSTTTIFIPRVATSGTDLLFYVYNIAPTSGGSGEATHLSAPNSGHPTWIIDFAVY